MLAFYFPVFPLSILTLQTYTRCYQLRVAVEQLRELHLAKEVNVSEEINGKDSGIRYVKGSLDPFIIHACGAEAKGHLRSQRCCVSPKVIDEVVWLLQHPK